MRYAFAVSAVADDDTVTVVADRGEKNFGGAGRPAAGKSNDRIEGMSILRGDIAVISRPVSHIYHIALAQENAERVGGGSHVAAQVASQIDYPVCSLVTVCIDAA
ncbi:hypothetical protein SDC9_72506 [bioreactor metagenome]|uniref:Uncharacterized protein n=1 Tax=bioreactor metagenome TaxID=1076179 RepID=A0A644YBT6_9ZZZZ